MTDTKIHGYDVALLWLVLVVGMVLHFNYGVSGLRYGVPLEQPGATGQVPWSNFVIKTVFYVVPLLMAVACTSDLDRKGRMAIFGMSLLFAVANAMHLVTTAMAADDVLGYAQIVLLGAVLLANGQLIRRSRRWWRAG
ncbi:MAG: hypothetical protein AAF799_00935 [Myxococcota bacterium]